MAVKYTYLGFPYHGSLDLMHLIAKIGTDVAENRYGTKWSYCVFGKAGTVDFEIPADIEENDWILKGCLPFQEQVASSIPGYDMSQIIVATKFYGIQKEDDHD